MQAIRARALRVEIRELPITVAPADGTDVPAEVAVPEQGPDPSPEQPAANAAKHAAEDSLR